MRKTTNAHEMWRFEGFETDEELFCKRLSLASIASRSLSLTDNRVAILNTENLPNFQTDGAKKEPVMYRKQDNGSGRPHEAWDQDRPHNRQVCEWVAGPAQGTSPITG